MFKIGSGNDSMTRQIGPQRNAIVSRYLVAPLAADGYYTTIAAAITQAVADGATGASPVEIVIKPGTFTENLTLYPGVNLVAYSGLGDSLSCTIVGKMTANFSGSCTVTGIRLQTNGDHFLSISGNNAMTVNLFDCYFNCTDATGIFSDSTSPGPKLIIFNCLGNLVIPGIAYFNVKTLTTYMTNSLLTNDANSTTASAFLDSPTNFLNTSFRNAIGLSGASNLELYNSGVYGAISLLGTSFANIYYSLIESGADSAVTVGAGTSVTLNGATISSSATNVITGAGSATYSDLSFIGSSTGINATTVLDYPFGPNLMMPAGGAYRTSKTAGNTALLQAYDTLGTSYTTFGTLTANNPPTFDLSASTTVGGDPITHGTVTNHAIVLGSTSNAIKSLGVAGNGELVIGSTGADPVLATLTAGTNVSITNAAGSITINASANDLTVNYTSINNGSSPYTVASTDYFIGCDVSGGVITVRLPNAPSTGRIFAIKDTTGNCAANNITVTTVGGAVNIDGAATYTMNSNYQAIQLIFNGTSYNIY